EAVVAPVVERRPRRHPVVLRIDAAVAGYAQQRDHRAVAVRDLLAAGQTVDRTRRAVVLVEFQPAQEVVERAVLQHQHDDRVDRRELRSPDPVVGQLRTARAAIRERAAGGAAGGRQRAQAQPRLQRLAPGETTSGWGRRSVLWVFAAGQDCSSIYGSRPPVGFRGVNYSSGLDGAQAEPRSFVGVSRRLPGWQRANFARTNIT